ncbi:MAG: cyanophycin synthetase [Pseudomonadota bacterium]
MQILDARTYLGPNLYANFQVIRFTLDLGPLEDWPSARIPGFNEGLLAAIPSLDQHTCSYDHAGGFIRRLTEDGGTWLGHVLEHVAIELQNLVGCKVSFGKTRGSGTRGQYHVVYQYEEPWVGEAAGQLALRLLHSLVPAELRPGVPDDPTFNLLAELEALIRQAQRRAFGPSTASLVRAAEAREIPWIRLNNQSLVQFGYGCVQKRIEATVTSETRHISVEIASDKELTNRILGELGLPVARQCTAETLEEALGAAREIGFPLVVKPLDANHGRGVSIGLTSEEQVCLAFEQALLHSDTVILESFIAGFDHRMLVVNGALVAAAKRVPGHVVGDGVHTVAELVEQVNQDPRRGIGHEKVLTRLELDFQALRLLSLAGFTPATVLPAGQTFYLRSTGNLSTGGTAIDVTDLVHPDNREMAVRAAKAIGLDVCGVDFLTEDIGRSYKSAGGGICEINAAPGFRMHVSPAEGRSRDVAGAVMDMLFPPGTPTRIPIAAVTGTNGKTTVTRMLAHIHKLCGGIVGMTTTDGVYIDGQRTVEGDMTGPVAASMVLRDPTVSVAVLETARGGLLRAGLGYPAPDVACCINVQGDHLGLKGIHTLAQLALVKRIPIEVATDTAVLNADDEHCLAMADHTEAKRICYVTRDPHNMLVREHIRAGGRAVALEEGVNGDMITIYDKGTHIPLLWTHLIPATMEGLAMHNVQNAMFAAAMAFSMGLRLDDIRHGLRTYDSSFFQAPGRMNVFDRHPFKVILDYGHNPAAVEAMCDLIDGLARGPALKPGGLRRVVLAAPGDRRDEDIRAIAQRAARSFDHFFCRPDDDPRGRPPTEVPAMLREELLAAGVPDTRIVLFETEEPAVVAALAACQPGDLLLVFGDNCTRCWKQIIYFGDRARDRQAESPARPALPALAAAPAAPEAEVPPPWEPPANMIRDERGVRLARQRED